jgi:hypothetical protein
MEDYNTAFLVQIKLKKKFVYNLRCAKVNIIRTVGKTLIQQADRAITVFPTVTLEKKIPYTCPHFNHASLQKLFFCKPYIFMASV